MHVIKKKKVKIYILYIERNCKANCVAFNAHFNNTVACYLYRIPFVQKYSYDNFYLKPVNCITIL